MDDGSKARQDIDSGLDRFPPYPEYKDSGVEWLGEVPAHWEVQAIRSLAQPGYKTFTDGDWIESPYIRDVGVRLIQTGNVGVGQYREQGFRYIDEQTFHAFQCTEVMPGDVLICRLADPVGRACLAPDLGCQMITSVDVCILKAAEKISPNFVVYALSTEKYLGWLSGICRGGTRDRVSRSMLGATRIWNPPLPEQRAIADYLDSETAKIDALVAKNERLIELLQEKRSALITHAATKGLDPDVPMKDSGVEWLGKIPAHWDTTTLKYVAEKIVDCPHETPHYSPDGFHLVIRTSDLESGQLNFGHCLRVNEQEYLRRVRRETLKPGDIVYGREGERWGHAAIVPAHISLCLGQRMMQLRMKRMSNSKYYMWHLNASSIYQQGSVDIFGATSPHVNVITIRNYWLVEPPQNEQHAIVALLDRETAKIDALIAKVREAIERLKELRTALISAAVTGKIDVREAAT